ncbi:MAG TPA: NlpC/P60 family protein [Luteimonas sp.]
MSIDARPFLGIPYAEADCRALVKRVLAAHGIDMPASPAEAKAAGWTLVDRPVPLDLAIFNTPAGRHVGVVVSRGQFLHADCEAGESRVERLGHPEWTAQLEGFYRHG